MVSICRRRLVQGLVLAALMMPVTVAPAAALEPGRAQAFLEDVAGRATSALASDAPLAARREELRDVLQGAFDIEYIGRLVLGRTYSSLSDSQREAYDDAFERYVMATYSRRIGDYGGEQLEVLGAEAAGSQDVKVESRVIGIPNQPPVRLDWRVRERADGLKIIDVEIEGVSMAISQRSEFSSVVQQRGIDGLIAMLQERSTSS